MVVGTVEVVMLTWHRSELCQNCLEVIAIQMMV